MRQTFHIGFIKKSKIFFGISLGIMLVCLVLNIFVFPTKVDIQFTGGTIIKYSYSGDVKQSKIEKTVNEALDDLVIIKKNTLSYTYRGNVDHSQLEKTVNDTLKGITDLKDATTAYSYDTSAMDSKLVKRTKIVITVPQKNDSDTFSDSDKKSIEKAITDSVNGFKDTKDAQIKYSYTTKKIDGKTNNVVTVNIVLKKSAAIDKTSFEKTVKSAISSVSQLKDAQSSFSYSRTIKSISVKMTSVQEIDGNNLTDTDKSTIETALKSAVNSFDVLKESTINVDFSSNTDQDGIVTNYVLLSVTSSEDVDLFVSDFEKKISDTVKKQEKIANAQCEYTYESSTLNNFYAKITYSETKTVESTDSKTGKTTEKEVTTLKLIPDKHKNTVTKKIQEAFPENEFTFVKTDVKKDTVEFSYSESLASSNKNAHVVSVQFTGNRAVSNEDQVYITGKLQDTFPKNNFTVDSFTSVDPSKGPSFFFKCLAAVIMAAVIMIFYVAIRFRKIGGLSAGIMAVVALIHDLIIVYFVFAIFQMPLNDNFIAVVLMILGYSLNDTIVIYDRIRENRRKAGPKVPIGDIVDTSLNQCMFRTICTSITTIAAIASVLAVSLIFNITSIVSFALPMMIGLISGSYSSLCIAAPLWVIWKKHDEKKKAAQRKTQNDAYKNKSADKVKKESVKIDTEVVKETEAEAKTEITASAKPAAKKSSGKGKKKK